MSKDKKNSSKNDPDKAQEPEIAFKTIRIFNSFEEQEKEEIRWLASQTPEQHLHNATLLIKRVFAEELQQHPEIGNQLYFD